jgi:hypothetical protein
MSDALADAARLLIAEAAPETVRRVLRMLLDDVAPAATPPVRPPPPPRPPTPPPAAQSAAPRTKRAAPATRPPDAAWEALRTQIRAAMREQTIDFADLGAALGVAPANARVAIYRKQPPSRPLAAKLKAWLEANTEQAPEVAAPSATFRGRGNGSAAAAGTVARVPAASV